LTATKRNVVDSEKCVKLSIFQMLPQGEQHKKMKDSRIFEADNKAGQKCLKMASISSYKGKST
jgi:hypothetical protein